jgi:uncharacterized SAM-binding protein YcdF (DUF218 family)
MAPDVALSNGFHIANGTIMSFIEGSVNEIEHLTSYLFLDFPQAPTELCVVLANGALSAPNALETARLFHAGLFDRIIVSGGMPIDQTEDSGTLAGLTRQFGQRAAHGGEIEAHYIHDLLLGLDVPSDRITVEDQSRNTADNITFSLPLGLDRAGSVTLITNALLARRSLMTLRKYRPYPFPAVSIQSVLPIPGINRHTWQHNPLCASWLRTEYRKTLTYVDEGYCAEIDLNSEIALAAMLCMRSPAEPFSEDLPSGTLLHPPALRRRGTEHRATILPCLFIP